jgi:FixJ family two-component response regulator
MQTFVQDCDEATPLVLVVDDDGSVRDALEGLFKSVGLDVILFASAADLIAFPLPERPSCLVLDVRLPGANGLEVHGELLTRRFTPPVIFITGHGDIPMSVRAMKNGAVDFLSKPFRDQDLIDAVYAAIQADRERRRKARHLDELAVLFNTLTPREKEVVEYVSAGFPNKLIANEMGLSEHTVKVYRGNVMRKMKERSLAGLLRSVQMLNEAAHAGSGPERILPVRQGFQPKAM